MLFSDVKNDIMHVFVNTEDNTKLKILLKSTLMLYALALCNI